MSAPTLPSTLPPTLLALMLALTLLLASALLTRLTLVYAERRRLLDLPGGRRLHDRPTVRGAGAGAMLLLWLTCLLLAAWQAQPALWLVAGGLSLLLLAGWIDDHRPLSARVRVLAQALAATLLVVAVVPPPLPLQLLAGLGTLWLVNLYNFIDGSDLFACSHAVLAGTVVALLASSAGDPLLALLALALAAVMAGFAPFNWPPARAFMGDVASAPIGFWLAALLLLGWQRGTLDPLLMLALLSGLVSDATLTLWQRVRSGRRWHLAHRSHLYQWLRRRGHSALAVSAAYLGWALLALLLNLFWPDRLGGQPVAFVVTYLLAALLWLTLRRRLLELPQGLPARSPSTARKVA